MHLVPHKLGLLYKIFSKKEIINQDPSFCRSPAHQFWGKSIGSVGGGTVGGAVIAGQSPAGIVQNVSGAVADVLQDITSIIHQAAVSVVSGRVMIGSFVVHRTIAAISVVVSGSVGSVVSGGFTGNSAAIVLAAVVLAAAAAGGQGKHQKQGDQQKCQTSFQTVFLLLRDIGIRDTRILL